MPAVGITDGPPPCARDHRAVVRPLVLPPSQKVGGAWALLNLAVCKHTSKGVFQRNPQS